MKLSFGLLFFPLSRAAKISPKNRKSHRSQRYGRISKIGRNTDSTIPQRRDLCTLLLPQFGQYLLSEKRNTQFLPSLAAMLRGFKCAGCPRQNDA